MMLRPLPRGAAAAAALSRRAPRPRAAPVARRSLFVVRARSSDHPDASSAAGPFDTSEDPAAALAACLAHIESGDLDALLEFVPDEVIDRVIEMRRCNAGGGEPSWLRFTDVLQANANSLLYLDSFAIRHLAHGAPRSLRALSAVRVSAGRYLQRCAVVSQSGEEAVLSFEMAQEECLESQYRGPPLLRKRWMLRSVRGESGAGDANAALLPARPSPAYAPEAVLQAQLAALREQAFVSVFAHASPANKRATGPVKQFVRMLQAPLYAPLLGHAAAETLQRLQPSPTLYMELVRVHPAAAAPGGGRAAAGGGGLTYLWVLSRQGEGSPHAGCWMVDSVQPLDAVPPPQLGA